MVELVTPAEAATELRVSLATIYGWLNGGRVLPGRRLGGLWRISRADLDAVVAGELVAPAPQVPVTAPNPSAGFPPVPAPKRAS